MADLPDIEHDADVRALVEAFYGGIEDDPLLGPYFTGLDWNAHLPTMTAFWHAVLFQSGAYRGQPFAPHARLAGLERAHFARWLDRFCQTLDARFSGPRADLARARAEQIAGVFQVKLGLWTVADDDGPSRTGHV